MNTNDLSILYGMVARKLDEEIATIKNTLFQNKSLIKSLVSLKIIYIYIYVNRGKNTHYTQRQRAP